MIAIGLIGAGIANMAQSFGVVVYGFFSVDRNGSIDYNYNRCDAADMEAFCGKV